MAVHRDPAAAATVKALVGGARLVTIPGAGHIVNLDAADAFNRSVLAFLAER